jgi:hypothetical protein
VKISKGLEFDYYYNVYTPSVGITIIKSAKKLKSKVNGLKIELKEEYTYNTGKLGYRFRERSETLKLLH